MHYLGNRLDRLLQMSQDGETNGVPTGNIITRIIMELCMAKFDSRLRLALGNEVNFARYVDDIYFGFNNDKELLKIKTTINELASQYNLTLNNSKCSSITYLEIDNSSKLIDYFDNRQINFSNEEKIAKQLNNFYLVARDEILSGVKGTDKLIFTSLRYFIENLEKENIEIFLKGLIYSSENGKGFIDKLMQLVILDSRLIVYFIQLLNIIFEKEREINVATVTNYLKKKITEKYFFHILKANLKENFLNYKNQESYSTLLILSKLQVLLPLDYVMNILEQISKEKIEEYDDFSLILLISNVLSNPLNNKNFLFDRLINCLNQIVSNDYLDKVMALKSFDGKYFSYNHWLLKYYLFYNYKTNLNFKLKIKKFYKNAGTKFGKQYMNFEAFSKLTSNRSTSSKKLKSIDTFYLKLLENNINLSFVPKVYKSNNIL